MVLKIKYLVLVMILLLFGKMASFASNDNQAELKSYEDSLKSYFFQLAAERNDLAKENINAKIINYFKLALNTENSFDYNFGSLKNVGIIKSPDENLRIITWNLPYNDRTHKYFGFIQYKKSRRETVTFQLNDESDFIGTPEFAVLDQNKWYGALYYQIIDNKYRGTTYYTLLGVDLHDILTKKKIIEILYFDSSDQPVFGKRVFKNVRESVTRVIFEYSAQADMVLTYDKEKEMIIYDHLSPYRPSLKGQYEFYGPDFSYDGLKFERGIWNSYPDLDVRNYSIE
jgi:hypothetical protein